MLHSLRKHWPEYVCEAIGLGLFMLSAALFCTLLEHPGSPVRQALPQPLARHALMGLAMGLIGIANVYSPWGRRSGCHLNPALTCTFLVLGKVRRSDALFYVVFQLAGGLLGLGLAGAVLGMAIADPSVRFVATVPGDAGVLVACAAEVGISFVLMLLVLSSSNHPRTAPLTGLFTGALVCLYITFESPLSGASMNPARTLASAVPARVWTGLWIYLWAPLAGMLGAAAIYRTLPGARRIACAKLHHDSGSRCIFRCNFLPSSHG